MGHGQDFKYKDALRSLFDTCKTVTGNVYVNDRPAATPGQMEEFIVVSLPGQMSSATYGSGFGNVRTYCTLESYVRLKKSGVEDVDRQSVMVGKLLSLFPISNGSITASRPRVVLKGADGLGFSAVLIRADLRIK